MKQAPSTLVWDPCGTLRILDQRRLPHETAYLECTTREMVFDAIQNLSVRGAPAIGIAGAYGLCLDVVHNACVSKEALLTRLQETGTYLKSARPTAVNLSWAIDRLLDVVQKTAQEDDQAKLKKKLIQEADTIHKEDRNMCTAMGQHGLTLLKNAKNILTHCNTGYLATGGTGTALAVIYAAKRSGKDIHVYIDETRPLLQGARLTAFEMQEAGIPATLLCDSAAASLMKEGLVDCILTGADRIAMNGDAANKIGTYGLAVLAKHHHIPFYIAAPSSTFDAATPTGKTIQIEERHADEVRSFAGKNVAPVDFPVRNPAFDVTDASLIHAFITEAGVLYPPYTDSIARLLQGARSKYA